MTYEITRKDLAPQPVLLVRRRVKRSEIAATIGASLPHIFLYAQKHGIALAGHPFTRYVDVGAGLITMEPGMRVATPAQAPVAVEESWTAASGDGEVIVCTLPGGPAAATMHTGPYDTLTDAYGALEAWIEAQGLVKGGAPWEDYITDPGEVPDPKDWRTEVTWPLSA